ncbi:MAG: histidine kinase [Bacteroidota bacterium]
MGYLLSTYAADWHPFPEPGVFWFGVGAHVALVELALQVNAFLQTKWKEVQWMRWFNLHSAVLSLMAAISVLLGMMIVSDLPGVTEQQGITVLLDFEQIFGNLGQVVSFSLQFFFFYLSLYFFYYINDKLLISQLLRKRGILIYLLGAIGAIALFFPIFAQILVSLPIVQLIPSLMPATSMDVFEELNALMPFIVLIFSLPVILTLQWFQQNSEISQLAKQKLETELGLLKQQINPHFFFNTLNNLYSLSLSQSAETPEVIMRLSELMRYVIYRGRDKLVGLSEEMDYIEDYIGLQQIRMHKQFDLQMARVGEEAGLEVPPLLFIILVENAFKHGIEPSHGACHLHIELSAGGDRIVLRVENSFEAENDKESGIGLENLRRRLDLLYPDRHELRLDQKDGIFIAELTLWMT